MAKLFQNFFVLFFTEAIHELISFVGKAFVELEMFPLENEPPKLGNRTRVEILSSILNVAERGALKTHIMYKANLSHRQLEKYLAFLKENGLLQEVSDPRAASRLYHATEKGIAFLKDYSRLSGYFIQKDAEVRI